MARRNNVRYQKDNDDSGKFSTGLDNEQSSNLAIQANTSQQNRSSDVSSADEDISTAGSEGRLPLQADTPSGRTRSSDASEQPRRRSGRRVNSQPRTNQRSILPSAREPLFSKRLPNRRVSAATSSLWRWLVVLYIVWLLSSHLIAAVYVSFAEK